jgi:chromosome segregation ATPase
LYPTVQLANYEKQADTEIDTLESKQVELLDTIEALRIKNQELQDVIGSQNEYQSIIKKRTSSLLPDRKLPTPVKNVETLDINRKYKFLKDKFTQLEQEKNELLESEKILLKQLEVANKNYEKAMEKLEDQEEMQYAMNELETDKKTLQDAYNIALDKVQQKTLAIEMLQRNVDKTRDRMEPLQKSVEALDDLQDLLEQERYAKEELQDHIVSLEEDSKEQQKKILELMEQLGNKDTITGVCNIHFFNFF